MERLHGEMDNTCIFKGVSRARIFQMSSYSNFLSQLGLAFLEASHVKGRIILLVFFICLTTAAGPALHM